jgi:hypothetical protein
MIDSQLPPCEEDENEDSSKFSSDMQSSSDKSSGKSSSSREHNIYNKPGQPMINVQNLELPSFSGRNKQQTDTKRPTISFRSLFDKIKNQKGIRKLEPFYNT